LYCCGALHDLNEGADRWVHRHAMFPSIAGGDAEHVDAFVLDELEGKGWARQGDHAWGRWETPFTLMSSRMLVGTGT
jgi:hypothetical protein